jgi:hypothetical protein
MARQVASPKPDEAPSTTAQRGEEADGDERFTSGPPGHETGDEKSEGRV